MSRDYTESGQTESAGSRFQHQSAHEHPGHPLVRMILTGVCAVALIWAWLLPASGSSPHFGRMLYFLSYLAGAWFAARQAFDEIRHGHVTVDVLMLLAAFGAYVVGEVPEGAFLLFLYSLSGTLEQQILGRTRAAIRKMIEFNPTEANVLRDGVEVSVPVEEVAIGDRVIIRPGERVPIDGIIREGTSSIDQSPLTGESIPVDKSAGDFLLAGTINLQGSLEVECRRRGEETTLARLIQMVEEAQSKKAESETISRWFGERYTIAVIVFAVASFIGFLVWGVPTGAAFYRAMTVLVVASPCAIVISVPAAILSAIANAARSGVLIKGGVYLERLATLEALAFDKTGTFTMGVPKVLQIFPSAGNSERSVLEAAASAEILSEHPLARAIVEEGRTRGVSFSTASSLRSIPGKGVVVEMSGGGRILLGKKELFDEAGVSIPAEISAAVRAAQLKGWTTLIVGQQGNILGSIAIADSLRPGAAETLQQLRTLGIKRFIMLTGDNERVAAEVAKQLGSEFAADLLPEDKLHRLRELRANSKSVGMIGDGVNDAPSLAAADVGLSLGDSGTGVALEAADVVLMGGDLTKLTYAIRLAQRTQVIIRQNLFFAGGVMLVLLSLSLFHGIRMPLAVIGHEGSTVLVILNGLRLLWSPSEVKTARERA